MSNCDVTPVGRKHSHHNPTIREPRDNIQPRTDPASMSDPAGGHVQYAHRAAHTVDSLTRALDAVPQ